MKRQVTLFNLNLALFGMLWGVATGLGLQWTLGMINVSFLWIFGVPVTYYCALVRGGGLTSVWTWINFPYIGMNISLIAIFVCADWNRVRTKIQGRNKLEVSMDLEGQRRRSTQLVETEAEALLDCPRKEHRYGTGTSS